MLPHCSPRPVFDLPRVYSLRRREQIPCQGNTLWWLQAGAVRVHAVPAGGKGHYPGFFKGLERVGVVAYSSKNRLILRHQLRQVI